MTEQEKREKVIKGLLFMKRGYSADSFEDRTIDNALALLRSHEPCDDCISRKAALNALHRAAHWYDAEKRIETLPTVELKAQEPRVMTLEEVTSLEANTPVYIEQCDGLHGWDVYAGLEDGTGDIITGAPWATSEYWPRTEYGDTWRCWTSCLTDAKRKAIPWVE